MQMTLASKFSGYLTEHPAGTAALGIMPIVAGSHTLLSAVLMASGFVIVLLLSSVSLSCIRNLVPQRFRLVFILLISSTWVAVLDMLLQAFVFQLRMSVDIYLPLLAMNSLVLMMMEKSALTTPVPAIAVRVLGISVFPVAICLISGALREWLAHGALLTDALTVTQRLPAAAVSLPLAETVAGAFIVTGCLLAVINAAESRLRQNVNRDDLNGKDKGPV